MALLLVGKTTCALCGITIAEADEALSFPPFVADETDPLNQFNDAAVHKACFATHPARAAVKSLVARHLTSSRPGGRICVVCNTEVRCPDEWLFFGLLSSDATSELASFNFKSVHRDHFATWPHAPRLLELLRASKSVGLRRLATPLR